MDIERLYQILKETTYEFRKGDEVVERNEKGVKIVEIFAMPPESDASFNLQKVDCHFVIVGVDATRAKARRQDLKKILAEYPQPERLAGGPSYIEMGAILGSQDAALRLFALGEVLGFWKVITPKTLGIEGPEADRLAGTGLVMISGYKAVG